MSRTSIFQRLDSQTTGDVVVSSAPEFGYQRDSFYGGFHERRPDAVIEVADPSDVARAITFARENEISLAVRAGGHSLLGHSSPDGGLVIDLARVKPLDIDSEGRTAWAGGGLLAGEYTAAVAEHGLITGFGDTASVGITGITLGGGVGFLHRKLGLTIDNVLAAEVVTADGQIRVIDGENDPDLFWAIRGGGGNFGVVTRFRYRLHPVDEVLGGMLILPASPQVVADFVGLAESASDDLSIMAQVTVAPPLPWLPEEVHGKLILMAVIVHAGALDIAETEIEQFRKLATPLVDDVGRVRYASMFEEEPPGATAVSVRGFLSDEFTLDDAETAIAAVESSPGDASVIQIRVLGGAVASVAANATAFAHRDRTMIVNVVSAYEDPDNRAESEEWVEALGRRLQHGGPGAYANFHADDSPDAVRELYPGETWERLVDVKTKHDPDNTFSSNHNIPPRG